MAENTRYEHRSYVLTIILFIAAATGICWLFRFLRFPETNIVVVYILSVLLTAQEDMLMALLPQSLRLVCSIIFLPNRILHFRLMTPPILSHLGS